MTICPRSCRAERWISPDGGLPARVRNATPQDGRVAATGAGVSKVLADRYLGRFTRPGAAELRVWLERWAELPEARAIHALLLIRLPRGEAAPPAPPVVALPHPADGNDDASASSIPVPEESEPAGRALLRNDATDRAVLAIARTAGDAAAGRIITQTRRLPPAYGAQLRGEAARILFTLNRDKAAYGLGVRYLGVCCGAGPHHIRAMAEALGRRPPASRYSPDMSRHSYFGTDPMLKAKNREYAARL